MPETNLKRMRQAAGLTQKELAEKAEINLRTYQDYEQGKTNINTAKAEKVLQISKVLKCKMEDILN